MYHVIKVTELVWLVLIHPFSWIIIVIHTMISILYFITFSTAHRHLNVWPTSNNSFVLHTC